MALQRIKLRRTRQQFVGLLPSPFPPSWPSHGEVCCVIDAYVPARALRACGPYRRCVGNNHGDSDACVHRPLSLKHSKKGKIINDRFGETNFYKFHQSL